MQMEKSERTWDLRGYTGTALALLTNRHRAYGYRHTERFLAELAQLGADEVLTEALAGWTASLWKRQQAVEGSSTPVFYIDGHRKAVYTDGISFLVASAWQSVPVQNGREMIWYT